MTLVVDANVAVKWMVSEEMHHQAHRLIMTEREELHAPDIALAEVANVSWKKWRRGELTWDEAEAIPRIVRGFLDVIHHTEDLYERAMTLALELDHPAYDCFYLACAEAADAVLVTADRRLCEMATRAGLGEIVRHLADLPP